MERRTFLGTLAASLLAAPLAAEAQQAAKIPRIGYIGTLAPTSPEGLRNWETFLQGLGDQGYSADRALAIEGRYLEGRSELAPLGRG